ncbi:hypothetical protein BDV12DRAFT_189792 [Aspergillus spectabilis]
MYRQTPTTTSYKNIILVGAGGSLGSVLLNSLLSEPAFRVTILARESPKALASIPSSAKVITISDSYPAEDLVKAFKGQDAIVNAITSFSVAEQLKFIDAAIEAGVKRYIPSEYGLDNNTPAARELSPVFGNKGHVQDYLKGKEASGLTWTAIASNTALALNRILLNPSLSANQIVFLSDFATTQEQLAWDNGDAFAGYGLINIGFTKGTYSGHFEPAKKIWNKDLGLPGKELEGVVREALGEVGHSVF